MFSVEHPVITSCDRAWQGQGLRQEWTVDDYFRTGERKTDWIGFTDVYWMSALIPGSPARRSLKRLPPNIISRMISSAQRSPINSSAKAVPPVIPHPALGRSWLDK